MTRHIALHFRRGWRPSIRRQLSRQNVWGAAFGLAAVVAFALLVMT